MQLSRKEIYRNQKISLGVTLLSFIVMLLFFIFGKVATARPTAQKAAENFAPEVALYLSSPESIPQEQHLLAALSPEQRSASKSAAAFSSEGELAALTSLAGSVTEIYKRVQGKTPSPESGPAEIAAPKSEGTGTKVTQGYTEGSPGFGFDLDKRTVVSLPDLMKDTGEQGTVVIEIRVNSRGEVIDANPNGRGTTTSSSALKAKARKIALLTKFNPSPGTGEQEGSITINFSFD